MSGTETADDLLPGFVWAVPRAFSAAVSVCRFEQGDVLYREARAYVSGGDAWSDPASIRWIQVQEPARTSRVAGGEGETKRFFANWDSTVELLISAPDGDRAPSRLRTSQGRLFSCLWRDRLDWLDPTVAVAASEGGAEADGSPVPPLLLRDLQRDLGDAIPALRRHFRRWLEGSAARPGAFVEGGSLLVLAVDRASDPSRIKARAIEGVLAEQYGVRTVDWTPERAGVRDGERHHPALAVRGIAVASRDVGAIESHVRQLLYRAADGSGEGAADRFSLARHGLLVGSEEAGD